MNWREKVIAGMQLIAQGCAENPTWTACRFCPFDEYCDLINNDKENWDTTGEIFEKEVEYYLTVNR